MSYILPPIPEDLLLDCILKVIMEGTFDVIFIWLLELCLVNTDWRQMIRYHRKWLARFLAMQAN